MSKVTAVSFASSESILGPYIRDAVAQAVDPIAHRGKVIFRLINPINLLADITNLVIVNFACPADRYNNHN